MAKKRFSAKDIQTLLDFSGETGQPFTAFGVAADTFESSENKTFTNFMEALNHKSDLEIIDSILPNMEKEVDIKEEVLTDDDGKIRRYRVKKDREGKVIDKWLVDPVESITINDAISGINPYTTQFHRERIFQMMRDDVDPLTGDFKSGVGKSFWENSLDNSLTYQLGKLGASLIAGEELGKYGLDQTFFNALEFRRDGIFYGEHNIADSPEEIDLINRYLGKKTTYEADNFLDLFANTAATFAIDAPLFLVAGGVGSKVLGTVLPGVVNASHLPGKLVNHLLQNTMTLGLAQAPSIINHTMEGGTSAFLDDLQHLGKFSVMASVFGLTGEFIGTGVSHLLRTSKNLSMNQATTFLQRNPQVVKNLSGVLTSGGLGYFSTDGSAEDKMATALTFMSMHFANPQAWKNYVVKDQKNVMVEKDSFDLLRLAAKNGRTLEQGIKEVGAEVPRYFEREKNNLYTIDQNKFTSKGVVERIAEDPITLSKSNANSYSFISEVVPFVRKTFKQSFEDADRTKTINTVYDKKFKGIKNPYDKVKEKDSYEAFELNKQMAASVVGHLVYSDKLTKALRRNELPEDLKLDKFINETSTFFELPEKTFRTQIKDEMFRYIEDPIKFFEEGAYKFTPEQYKKQLTKGFQETLDAYESKAINEEINRILAKQQFDKDKQLEKHTEIQNERQKAIIEQDAKSKEIQNRQEPKETKREPITAEEQARLERAAALGKLEQEPTIEGLVTAEGRPLKGVRGAGLTEAERQRFGREAEDVKVKQEVDKIKTIPDLNEAIEKADSPTAIIEELKKRFTEKPIEGKKEVIKFEEEARRKAEELKAKTKRKNERARKRKKLRKAEFDKIPLEERAKLLLSKEEFAEFKEGKEPKKYKELIEDRFLAKRKEIREKTKPKEEIKVEEKKEVPETEEAIVAEIKERTEEVRKQYRAVEKELEQAGISEERLNELRFTEEGELKTLYDKAFALDREKHERIQKLRVEEEIPKEIEGKSVRLEDGTIITQDVKSHLSMKFTPEQRKVIADIGYVDKEGNFRSTMTVPLEAFKETIRIIAEETAKAPTGINPKLLYNYAKAGVHLFELGFNKSAIWAKEMLGRFGEGIKKFLGGIWAGTRAILTGEKALFDPNTLGIMGMQSGKEFEAQRAARKAELRETKPVIPKEIITEKQKVPAIEPEKVEAVVTEGKIEPSLKTITETIFAPENKMTSGERKTFKSVVSKLERYKPKKIKGRLVGTTLTADEHSRLHNIRKVVGVEANEKEALTNKVIEDLATLEMKPEHTATDRQQILDHQELFENLQRFGNLKDMRGEQLDFANEGLKEIIAEGRTKRRMKEEARLQRRNSILAKGIKDIGVPVSIAKARQLGYDVETPTFLRKLSEFDNRMLGFQHLLKKFSKKTDFLSDYFYKKQIKDANQTEDRGVREAYEGLQTKLQELYGLPKEAGFVDRHKFSKRLATNKERVKESGVFITEEKERIQLDISQNEAYKKWMEWQDPTVRPTMEKMGFNEESIAQLEKFIKPEVMEWAKWQIEEFYPTYYKGVNEAFRERFGVNLPFNKFYSPIERLATKEVIEHPLLRRGSQYATVVNQHLKMRVNSKAELKYLDGDQTLMKHIAEMEHFKAWVEPIREMRSVFGDKTFRTGLAQQEGETALKLLDDFVDDLARGGSDKSKTYAALDKVRANFTRAVIGMNPVVFVKQLTSFPAFAINIPVGEFFKGMGDFAANPRAATKILMESEMMKSRYNLGAMDRDVKDALAKTTSTKLAGARSVSDALMVMTKMGDRSAILAGGWGVYKYHKAKFLEKGANEEQAHKKAIREFEVAVETMQQSARIEDLSSIQRSGSIGKLFTMFMTAPNAYYRVASGAVRDVMRGKGTTSENVKKIAIAHFLLPMLFQFAADGFSWKDEKQLRAAMLGSLNGLLVVGDFLEAGFAGVQGDFHFDVEGTPVIQAPKQLIQGLDKLGRMIADDNFEVDQVLSFADKIAGGTSKFLGVPFDTFQRSVDAIANRKDVRQIIGWSEVALKQRQTDMQKYKRLANAWRKRYKANPTPENYATYLEYRKDYRRLLTQLKQEERTK